MNIKITKFYKRDSKVSFHEDVKRLRRFKINGKAYLQFIEGEELVKVNLEKGDRWEVVE